MFSERLELVLSAAECDTALKFGLALNVGLALMFTETVCVDSVAPGWIGACGTAGWCCLPPSPMRPPSKFAAKGRNAAAMCGAELLAVPVLNI